VSALGSSSRFKLSVQALGSLLIQALGSSSWFKLLVQALQVAPSNAHVAWTLDMEGPSRPPGLMQGGIQGQWRHQFEQSHVGGGRAARLKQLPVNGLAFPVDCAYGDCGRKREPDGGMVHIVG